MRVIYERRVVIQPHWLAVREPTQRPEEPRSSGVHLSAVTRILAVGAGKLQDYDVVESPFETPSDECYPLMWAIGVALEEFYASLRSASELIYKPGELKRDGIYGTPDGLLTAIPEIAGRLAYWECKTTSKKVQHIQSLWMYLKQGLGYCAMDPEVRHVLYDVTFLLGDYTRPYRPERIETLVEFDAHEVQSWWEIVVKTAPGAVRE